MRYIYFSLFFAALTLSVNAKSKLKSQSYSEVVTHFFKVYDLSSNEKPSQMVFEKRPEGYVAVLKDSRLEQELSRQLFWSNKKKKYLSLDFPKGVTEEEGLETLFLEDWKIRNYDLNPCFGYRSWASDVVTFLEATKNKTEDQWYSLGRAYSARASDYLHDNSGFADTSLLFHLPGQGQNLLTETQLQRYNIDRQNAIRCFDQIIAVNSNYPCIVGSIVEKRDNEYMTWYLDLSIYQNEEVAKSQVPRNLYVSHLYDFALNILNSCEENAVLVTNGDNDTYPLLYLQKIKGIRNDVAILNSSLLNTSVYINYVCREYALKHTILPEFHANKKFSYALIDASLESVVVPALLSKVQEGGDEVKVLPQDVRLMRGGDTCLISATKHYVLLNSLVLLDVIDANKDDRPINFMSNQTLNLKEYLSMSGVLYTFTALTKEAEQEALYHFIKNTFVLDQRPVSNSSFERELAMYQMMFGNYLQLSLASGDRQYVDDVLAVYLATFEKTLPLSAYYELLMAKLSFELKNQNVGKECADRFLNIMYAKQRGDGFDEFDLDIIAYAKYYVGPILDKVDSFLGKKLNALNPE